MSHYPREIQQSLKEQQQPVDAGGKMKMREIEQLIRRRADSGYQADLRTHID